MKIIRSKVQPTGKGLYYYWVDLTADKDGAVIKYYDSDTNKWEILNTPWNSEQDDILKDHEKRISQNAEDIQAEIERATEAEHLRPQMFEFQQMFNLEGTITDKSEIINKINVDLGNNGLDEYKSDSLNSLLTTFRNEIINHYVLYGSYHANKFSVEVTTGLPNVYSGLMIKFIYDNKLYTYTYTSDYSEENVQAKLEISENAKIYKFPSSVVELCDNDDVSDQELMEWFELEYNEDPTVNASTFNNYIQKLKEYNADYYTFENEYFDGDLYKIPYSVLGCSINIYEDPDINSYLNLHILDIDADDICNVYISTYGNKLTLSIVESSFAYSFDVYPIIKLPVDTSVQTFLDECTKTFKEQNVYSEYPLTVERFMNTFSDIVSTYKLHSHNQLFGSTNTVFGMYGIGLGYSRVFTIHELFGDFINITEITATVYNDEDDTITIEKSRLELGGGGSSSYTFPTYLNTYCNEEFQVYKNNYLGTEYTRTTTEQELFESLGLTYAIGDAAANKATFIQFVKDLTSSYGSYFIQVDNEQQTAKCSIYADISRGELTIKSFGYLSGCAGGEWAYYFWYDNNTLKATRTYGSAPVEARDDTMVEWHGFAAGSSNRVFGMYSNSLGVQNTSKGRFENVMGCFNTADGEGVVAIGDSNEITGGYSHAFGKHLYTKNGDSVSLGFYNAKDQPSGVVSISAGTSDTARRNGITLMKPTNDHPYTRVYVDGIGGVDGEGNITSDNRTLQEVVDNIYLGLETAAYTMLRIIQIDNDGQIVTLFPNSFTILEGEIIRIYITLGFTSYDDIVNEYIVQFSTGNTVPTIEFPASIKWQVTPTIQANKTYQISVINNLAVIGEWDNTTA